MNHAFMPPGTIPDGYHGITDDCSSVDTIVAIRVAVLANARSSAVLTAVVEAAAVKDPCLTAYYRSGQQS